MSLKIGLTGGIASGKTTVSNLFTDLHIPVLDADVIAQELVQPGQPALALIIEAFGSNIIDATGQLDRQKLRTLVFRDPQQRKRLEAILHPRILQTLYQRGEALAVAYVIFSIPLLVETQQMQAVNRVLVVDCAVELQRTRLKLRNQFTDEEIDNILASQVQREERLAVADDVIHNDSDLNALRQQVGKLHEHYLQLSHSTTF